MQFSTVMRRESEKAQRAKDGHHHEHDDVSEHSCCGMAAAKESNKDLMDLHTVTLQFEFTVVKVRLEGRSVS